jgi:hypothetical protein
MVECIFCMSGAEVSRLDLATVPELHTTISFDSLPGLVFVVVGVHRKIGNGTETASIMLVLTPNNAASNGADRV